MSYLVGRRSNVSQTYPIPRHDTGDGPSTLVQAGEGISVDNTDPLNPIVSALPFEFPTVAAMALVDVDAEEIPDGTLAYTRTINDGYVLTLTPSAQVIAAIDGVSVVAAGGASGAVWVRLFWRNYDAWLQTTWFVDSANGDDTASGSNVGAPLRTLQELSYRLNGAVINAAVRVTLAAGTYPNVMLDVQFGPTDGASLIIQGTVSSSAAVSITSITNENPATNTRGSVQSAGTFSLGQRLRLTSAATPANVGAMTYVTRVIGAGDANVSQWGQVTSEIFGTFVTPANPVVGDQYVVDTLLTTLGRISIQAEGGRRSRIMVRDCALTPHVASGLTVRDQFVSHATNLMTGAMIYACTYTAAAEWQDCWGFVACCFVTTFVQIEGGHVNLGAVVANGLIVNGARVVMRGAVQTKGGLTLLAGAEWSANGPNFHLSVIDAAGIGISIQGGSVLTMLNAYIWGANNTLTTAVAVGMNSVGSYQTSTPVLAATNPVTLNGVTHAYTDNAMSSVNGAVWGLVS